MLQWSTYGRASARDSTASLSAGAVGTGQAAALSLSVFTVHNHLKNIYEKLGVHTRTEAALKYLQK